MQLLKDIAHEQSNRVELRRNVAFGGYVDASQAATSAEDEIELDKDQPRVARDRPRLTTRQPMHIQQIDAAIQQGNQR